MKTLYQEVEAELNDHLPLDWHGELRRRLMLLVMGILLSESCSPRQMAQALYQHGLSTAQEDSIARQIRRIENDERLTVETCLHPFAKHHLCFGKPQELILIMDATTHTDKIFVLMVSVRYRGRALPLAWQIWLANQPLQGLGFWLRVSQLLAQVATLLPDGIPVTWLADRAFGTPQFTDLIQAHGWHFIVRVQGQTRFADRMGYEHRLDQLSGKRQRFKGCGKVFKAAKWRDLNVVVLHSRFYPSALCLVTDLDPDWSIARIYRLRYNIEAMFRDYKSYGWHWEQSQVTDIDHSQRLLLGMAFATWLTLMLGTQVAHEYLSQVPTGKRRTSPVKQSLFQLGLQRLKQWAVGNFRHPLVFWLTGWHFPNWDDHIAQHHLFAYVMGTKSSFVKVQLYLYSTVRP
jgi:hypothetical protein